jgi:hypothetical protein
MVMLTVVNIHAASIPSDTFPLELAKLSIPQFPDCGYSPVDSFNNPNNKILNAQIDQNESNVFEAGTQYSLYFTFQIGKNVRFCVNSE